MKAGGVHDITACLAWMTIHQDMCCQRMSLRLPGLGAGCCQATVCRAHQPAFPELQRPPHGALLPHKHKFSGDN